MRRNLSSHDGHNALVAACDASRYAMPSVPDYDLVILDADDHGSVPFGTLEVLVVARIAAHVVLEVVVPVGGDGTELSHRELVL